MCKKKVSSPRRGHKNLLTSHTKKDLVKNKSKSRSKVLQILHKTKIETTQKKATREYERELQLFLPLGHLLTHHVRTVHSKETKEHFRPRSTNRYRASSASKTKNIKRMKTSMHATSSNTIPWKA